MNKTSIEWTDRSVNPIRARDQKTGANGHHCEKISPGCQHCYSSRLQLRFKLPEFAGESRRSLVEHFLDEKRLDEVDRLRKPSRIFWCDMTDLFGEWVSNEWIDRCLNVMYRTPQHTHQVLTKRPERMAAWLCRKPVAPNIWLGFSAENQEWFDKRAVQMAPLMRAGWTVFVSAEPLLGPIVMEGAIGNVLNCWLGPVGISWVIAGGESGPGFRKCKVAWIESLARQCQESRVPIFVKQDSAFRPGTRGRIPDSAWLKEFPEVRRAD